MVSHVYRLRLCGVVGHLIVSSGVGHVYGRDHCHGSGYCYGRGRSEDDMEKLQMAYGKSWRWGRWVQQSFRPVCGKMGVWYGRNLVRHRGLYGKSWEGI